MALDKILHIGAGALIAGLAYLVWHNLLIAFGLGLLAGVAKEVYDYFKPETHTTDVYDVLATAAGAAAMCLLIYSL